MNSLEKYRLASIACTSCQTFENFTTFPLINCSDLPVGGIYCYLFIYLLARCACCILGISPHTEPIVYAFVLQIPNYECLRMKWKRKKSVWMYAKRILIHSLHPPHKNIHTYVHSYIFVYSHDNAVT